MAKGKNQGQTFAQLLAERADSAGTQADELIKFSFKYLSQQNPKFAFASHDAGYFIEFLERLRSISLMKMTDFLANRSSTLRSHPIDWDRTSESSFGIPGEEQLVAKPYQFSLSANEHGRIHGFVVETYFYIVWLDKYHRLYP